MKILIDNAIPFINGVLEPYAEVEYLAPEEFTPERVHDADALIIRTRTTINQQLLEGSSVRFVATATIGFDHIDTAYCEAHQVQWVSCPGCNAQAVCDYIEEALACLPASTTRPTIGVVGIGHVGSLVAEMAERKGYIVLRNDPPRGIGVSLNELAEKCDVITFHTPLTTNAPFATYHLCDQTFLSRCKQGAVIINAARGGIIDEKALLQNLANGHIYGAIIDCWEDEPQINPQLLLSPSLIAGSMHIAGYSLQGKRNATQMCLNALSKYFALPPLSVANEDILPGDSATGWLARITKDLQAHPADFERLRKNYRLR